MGWWDSLVDEARTFGNGIRTVVNEAGAFINMDAYNQRRQEIEADQSLIDARREARQRTPEENARIQQELNEPYTPYTYTPPVAPVPPTPQEIFTSDYLAYGSTGPDVSRLQTFLGMNPTGVYDRATENNVEYYQSQRGLDVDGIVGPQTLNRIEQEIKQKLGLQASINGNIDLGEIPAMSFDTASADVGDITQQNVPHHLNTTSHGIAV